jgi:hypothetical protein
MQIMFHYTGFEVVAWPSLQLHALHITAENGSANSVRSILEKAVFFLKPQGNPVTHNQHLNFLLQGLSSVFNRHTTVEEILTHKFSLHSQNIFP